MKPHKSLPPIAESYRTLKQNEGRHSITSRFCDNRFLGRGVPPCQRPAVFRPAFSRNLRGMNNLTNGHVYSSVNTDLQFWPVFAQKSRDLVQIRSVWGKNRTHSHRIPRGQSRLPASSKRKIRSENWPRAERVKMNEVRTS